MEFYNPVAGLQEIAKAEIRPGDEVVWTWAGQQLNGARFYCHTILPLINGQTEREIKKQTDEFNFVIERDRTFYLVKRHNVESN